MTGAPSRLVLFDLDGTLVKLGSVLQRMHMDAMAAALAKAVGSLVPFEYRSNELFYRGVNLAGFTDAGTIRAALVLAGATEEEAAERIPDIVVDMVARLERAVPSEDWHGPADLLPGARAVLESIRGAGFTLGMSTGNARLVAMWKMRSAGLADLLYDGGFGDRAIEREDVARAGAAKLTPAGATPVGVLVGDTVRDITAARAAGLNCLAVTTGVATAGELRAAGADEVLPGIADGQAVSSLMRLARQSPRRRLVAHVSRANEES